MTFRIFIQTIFYFICDTIFAIIPSAKPSPELLRKAKIVAHRGERDNKTVFENTIAAFDKMQGTGVWAIELDIRWTKDLHPVVHHDPRCDRLFNCADAIADLDLATLRQKCPLIPTLAEVLERYGKTFHIFIELKEEIYPDPAKQKAILQDLLKSLEPIKDYHFISFYPALFTHVDFVPSQALMLIMYAKGEALSKLAIEKNYGGFLGYYALISQQRIDRHLQAGQTVGVGFIRSKNSLWREINRGATWIFTNEARKLQKYLD